MARLRSELWQSGRADADGRREYVALYLLEAEPGEGRKCVLDVPGLPQTGDPFAFGEASDPWATAQGPPALQSLDSEGRLYRATVTFSTGAAP